MTTEDRIAARLGSFEENNCYAHYRPLSEAADEFIHWAETPGERVYTGIPELDRAMRGTAPGELTLIQGFTHSGKTLVATEIMLNNPDTPMVLFTPDETRPLVLTKLTSALHGVGAEELERRIQQDDTTAKALLHETASMYGRLAIFDESVSVVDMDIMFDEAAEAFGERPKAVIFDYAKLLEGGEDVAAKLTALKRWGKRQQTAMFVLHQSSRTSGAGGQKMRIDSGEYGGEQQSTHVVGVRRKKYMHLAMIAILEDKIANASNPTSIEQYQTRINELKRIDLPRDLDTVTVSLNKNKRPPCHLVDDIDMNIDQCTGRLQRTETVTTSDNQMIRVSKSAALTHLRQRRAQQEFDHTMIDMEEF